MAKKTKSFSHIEAQDALEKLNESHPSGEELVYHLLSIFCGYGEGNIRRIREGVGNKAKDGRTILIPNLIAYRPKGLLDFHDEIRDMQSDVRIIKQTPRLYVVSDGKTIVAADPKEQDIYENEVALMWKDFDFFQPLTGIEKPIIEHETEADVKSAELMAKIFDEIRRHNDIKDKTTMHNLNIFMSRLLFCFFAEDTRLFPEPQLFTNSIRQHTAEDGHDLAEFIDRAFLAMSTDNPAVLDTLPKQFAIFPYVNGGLFEQRLPIPVLSRRARVLIIKCGDFNWKDINPDIFGSMIQAVVTPEMRAGLGMHYTSVPNIKKLIRPLFLDELNREFEVAKGTKDIKRLRKLLVRLGKIKFFDPACGSGNFLIVSYKCVRELEIQIWEVLRKWGEPELPMSNISLQQFYGIEIDDFACDTATLSLWLAEHQMNNKFETAFGIRPNALPLRPSGHIVCGNACRLDWETVCPHAEEEEVYVMGNPPYLGARLQSKDQKEDMQYAMQQNLAYNNLDYIATWFYKGSLYIKDSKSKLAFVTTNSICQGEQVALLWKYLQSITIEIYFAYSSFRWSNNAKNNAGVTCTIIGLRFVCSKNSPKYLFKDDEKRSVPNINPYLYAGTNVIVDKQNDSISHFPTIAFGSMPNDGGYLLLDEHEKEKLIEENTMASKIIHRILGSQEFIRDEKRYCLWITDELLPIAYSINSVKNRIDACKRIRESSTRESTKLLAATPYKFGEIRYKESKCIIIPSVSSERREYIPIGFLGAGVVVSNLAFAIYDAPLWLFGILTSKMHMAWVKTVGGRLETRYRYSAQLCYNTFPFPAINEAQKAELEKLAQEVLDVRDQHFDMTPGEQYNPETMPEALKEVHHRLDLAVERCYRPEPFSSDEERLECLFKLYAKMTKKTDKNAEKERLVSIEQIFLDEKKSDSFCMCPNCLEKAIGSHVFSRAHILQPISNGENKIYQFYRRPLIYIDDDKSRDNIFRYKLKPIVNAFNFKGFCQHHDTFLFKSIEPKNGQVDWTKKESQYLLSYRTICREIYANIVMQNVLNKLLTKEGIEKYKLNILTLLSQLKNLNLTKETLDYYQSLLERGIHNSNKDFADVHFQYLELPFQFDLCISAPIHVENSRGLCYNTDYQEINIVNIFPYYGKTIILLGYLHEFDNKWMNEILPKFKSPYPHIVSSAFVDILYRAEFHAMSPSLYDSLDKDLLDAFLRTWQMEANNYSNEIENKVSSLFYKPLNKLMPSTWKYL